MDLVVLFQIILLPFLLCLSAFFSVSETGLFSLSSVRIHRLLEERRNGAALVAQLLNEPREVLATILLLNLFVTVLSTAIAEGLAFRFFGPNGLEICIVVMSILILIFCDITPKVVAVTKAERVALFIAAPLKFFMNISSPVRSVFMKVADRVARFLIPPKPKTKEEMTSDQIITAIQMGHQDGILSEEEAAMLRGILDLNKKVVRDVMTPKDEIFGFEIRTPLLKVYEEIQKRKISRVPIYQDSVDQIAGILYSKDLILEDIVQLRAIQVIDLLRKPYFVPEDMPLDDLLRSLRTQRLHMAVVQDADKKVSGIVTLDDLIEIVFAESVA